VRMLARGETRGWSASANVCSRGGLVGVEGFGFEMLGRS
jgi:hypothetical protein